MNNLLRHPILISLGALTIGLLNSLFLESTALGFLCASIYLAGIGTFIQKRLSMRMEGAGIPLALSALMILGSLLYYIAPISTWGLFVTCLIPLTLGFKKSQAEIGAWEAPKILTPLSILGITLAGVTFSVLKNQAFDVAVRSPWDIVPTALVLFPFAILTVLTLHAALREKKEAPILLTSLVFLIFTVTPTVYKLGYGFDPFIHRATLEHILEHGTITPKPLYYIGQYALELIGVRIFGIPLIPLDTWLVPIFAALFLPYSVIRIAGVKKAGIPSLLLIPFTPFIFTTPQSLSYLFFALTVTGAHEYLRNKEKGALLFAWAMAFATLSIHPLSGIPAVCATLGGTVASQTDISKRALFWLSVAGIACAIPALFIVQSNLLAISFHIAIPDLHNAIPDFSNHFAGWLDTLYLYERFSFLLIVALAALGAYSLKKEKDIALWSTASALALLLSYFILSTFFEFSSLVESERANYANRLPYLALLASIPLLINGMHTLTSYIKKRPIAIPACIICLTLLATSNAYASFPRNDGETRSAGFNVSALDYETAKSIHELYPMGSYAVLANQSLSASALQTYGFTEYFKGEIFYYPIPTGGPLYDIFLKMSNEEASRAHAKEASELTGASHIIFVSHSYWSGSQAARERAKQEADKWYTVGNNQEIMIFLYDF